jgi:hypothetical protein
LLFPTSSGLDELSMLTRAGHKVTAKLGKRLRPPLSPVENFKFGTRSRAERKSAIAVATGAFESKRPPNSPNESEGSALKVRRYDSFVVGRRIPGRHLKPCILQKLEAKGKLQGISCFFLRPTRF